MSTWAEVVVVTVIGLILGTAVWLVLGGPKL